MHTCRMRSSPKQIKNRPECGTVVLPKLGIWIYCKFGSHVFTGAWVVELIIQYSQRILTSPESIWVFKCKSFISTLCMFLGDLSPMLPVFGSLELRQQATCCPSMEDIHAFKMQHKGKTVRYYTSCMLLIIPSKPSSLPIKVFLINIGSKTSNC